MHIVLGLGLGQAQRVDLHAITKPTLFRVRHAVPVAGNLFPHLGKRTHLGRLFDKSNASIDEERHTPYNLTERIIGDLPAGSNSVQHSDRISECKRQLLDRCGTSFLEVVAADVDRVPRRHFCGAERDHVDDQSQAWFRREDVRSPAQVFLDDVVLRGASQLGTRNALGLSIGDV